MITLLIVVVLLLIVIIFSELRDNSKEIHGILSGFKTLAITASDDKELRSIETSLKMYINKECWHARYTDHANEVLSYVRGKLNSVHGKDE